MSHAQPKSQQRQSKHKLGKFQFYFHPGRDSETNRFRVSRQVRTWIPILPPRPTNTLILLIDLQIDISHSLWDANSKIDTRVSRTDDPDFQWAQVLDWLIFDGEHVDGSHIFPL